MPFHRRLYFQTVTPTFDLKIKSVETFAVEGACFVKVIASNGLAGWGEADADNAPLMAAFIA